MKPLRPASKSIVMLKKYLVSSDWYRVRSIAHNGAKLNKVDETVPNTQEKTCPLLLQIQENNFSS